jgi:FKBP-type peptidyl-prolyl cis-trans isomerase
MLARSRALREKEEAKKKEDDAIKFENIQAGDATHYPQKYDSIAVHYIAYLDDGTVIDNSYNRGIPTYFVLGAGSVIRGWEKVLLSGNVSKGQKIKFSLPPEVGGDRLLDGHNTDR